MDDKEKSSGMKQMCRKLERQALRAYARVTYPRLVIKWARDIKAAGEGAITCYEDIQVDDYAFLNSYLDDHCTMHTVEEVISIWDELNKEERLEEKMDKVIRATLHKERC